MEKGEPMNDQNIVLIADPSKVLSTLEKINGEPYSPYQPTILEKIELEKTDYLVKFKKGDKVWHVWEWFRTTPNGEGNTGPLSDLVEILDHKVVRDFGNPSRGVLYYVKQPFTRKFNCETFEDTIEEVESKFWTHQCGLYGSKDEANRARM